jgi:hypothetical protein
MKNTFIQGSFVLIDRTYIDFSGIEFEIINIDKPVSLAPPRIEIKLTEKGQKQYIDKVKSRQYKYGTDEYLIDFVINELEGILDFHFEMDEGDEIGVYSQLYNLTERKSQ